MRPKLIKLNTLPLDVYFLQYLLICFAILGSNELDATPLLEYYEPLIVWLSNTIEAKGIYVGWDGPGIPFIEYKFGNNKILNS